MPKNFWDINMEELDAEDYLGIKRCAFRNKEFGFWLAYIGIPLWNIGIWYPFYKEIKQQKYLRGKLEQITFSGFFHSKLPFGYYWLGFDGGHAYNCIPFAEQKELTEGEYMDAGDILRICDEMIEEIHNVKKVSEDNFSKITESAMKNVQNGITTRSNSKVEKTI